MVKKRALALMMVLACLTCTAAWAEEGYFSALLIGEDRASAESIDSSEYPHGRADAIIAVTLNYLTGEIRMLSIDRDWEIELGEKGVTKLCIANYFGGPEEVVRQVNQLFGLQMDRYAMVDIQDMGEIARLIGGVEIEVTEADLEALGKGWKAGTQQLGRSKLMDFIGSREMNDLGDSGRNDRQQRALSAMMHKVVDNGTSGLMKLAINVFPLLETNLKIDEMLSIAGVAIVRGLAYPLQDRSPLPQEREVEMVNAHYVVTMGDEEMEREGERVREFLYGER